MIKFVTIIGARPQFIKAAALSRAIATHFPDQVKEVIIHTGQHYDANMSQVFFDEMKIPRPDHMLDVGSASHGKQTGAMIAGIEEIIITLLMRHQHVDVRTVVRAWRYHQQDQ